MEMAGGYEKRDRPRRDPRGAGLALMNTDGRGRGEPGHGGCGAGVGRGARCGRGGQEQGENEDGGSINGERELSNVNNDGQAGCWNCGSDKHWKHQCNKLTEEERAVL